MSIQRPLNSIGTTFYTITVWKNFNYFVGPGILSHNDSSFVKKVVGFSDSDLSPGYDYDFRNEDDTNFSTTIGQINGTKMRYYRPVGCQRFALNVGTKYTNSDWLDNY